jgi:hypothetical protein
MLYVATKIQFDGSDYFIRRPLRRYKIRIYFTKTYLITIQGDGRANQHPSLAIMQNLWLREHNRIAAQLGNINPGWNDETLFQASMKNPFHFFSVEKH